MLSLSTLWFLDHGQPVFPAKRIRRLPHSPVVFGGAVELDPIHKGNGVDNEVVVQVVFMVKVRGDKHLIPISPKALRQLDADLMGDLRGGLAGGKGLIPMVSHGAVFFTIAPFDRHHLFAGCAGEAIDAGHKALQDFRIVTRLLLGLVAVHGVFDHVREALRLLIGHIRLFKKGRVFGLVRVFNIHDHMTQPAVDAPEGSRRHYFSIGAGSTTASVMVLIAASSFRTSASYRWASMTFSTWAFCAI